MAYADFSHFRSLPQIPALTGLRFFAAFSILFAHAFDWIAQFQDNEIRSYFSFVAMYGMPLFFVLSGFVIHYNYCRLFAAGGTARAVCEFSAARFARLFPLYLFLLVMAFFADNLLQNTNGRPDVLLKVLAYDVTLTQSWWYIVLEDKLINYWVFGLAWSISTEMFFYVAYVAVVFIILSVRKVHIAVISAIGFAIGVMLLFVASRYYLPAILNLSQRFIPEYIDAGTNFEYSFYRWLFYFSPYTRVFEFFMGCLAAHAFILMRHRSISAREQRFANGALVAALAILGLFGALYLNAIPLGTLNAYIKHLSLNFLCAPALAVIMFYVGRYDTSFTRFLSSPTLVALGETSYSIYLVHTWTLRIFLRPAPASSVIWAFDTGFRIVFAIVFTLLVSYATYRLVEVPSRVWLRKNLGRMIALGFGDTGKSGHPAAASELTADLPRKTPHGKLAYSFAVILLLAVIAVVGQAARSDAVWNRMHRLWFGNRPEIGIVSATYGLNCKGFPVPAPFPNLAAPGNVTRAVKRACDARQRCDFLVDTAKIGDPANGCGKDFLVEYKCGETGPVKSAFLPPEAYGKKVFLSCDPPE